MTEQTCKGNPDFEAHAFVQLGVCMHAVGGATYGYEESACSDCGATARKQVVWACGTKGKAVRPTAENCLALKWKSERQVA